MGFFVYRHLRLAGCNIGYMKRFLPLLILPLLLWTTCEDKNTSLIRGGLTKKVLLIGVDGLSSTRLGEFNLPNYDRLIADGLYEDGTTVNSLPSLSGPGWSDILCGVNRAKHGVRNNSFTGSNYNQWPNFLERLEGINSSLNTAAVVSWYRFDHIFDNSGIDAYHRPSGDSATVLDEEVRDIAKDILANDNPDAIFVYFYNVDKQGHAHGGSSNQYRDAAETIDGYIGDLIDAVESRPAFNDENWLIMISSDHGHKDGGGHGGNSNHEMSVYMVMSGPNVLFSINGATDNTYFAPTAMTHVLGYFDSEWNLDGQVVGVPISKASNPSPADGAGPTGTSEILSWNQGSDMVSQFVYFGTDPKPDAGELKNYQTSSSYNTGTLNTNTTYYWRIDTNTPNGTVTGDVWSFTTTSGNDLISYWRFDDGSGDTAFDQGPYNLDGTLNGASWTDGRFGGALYFDGNDYVTVGQQAELRVADGLTISAWVKPGSFDDNQEGIAGYAYDTGPNESGYRLQMNANGSFGFALDVTPGDMKFIETAGGYNTNTWYYVTATYDGQSIKLYVDGVLGATGSVNGNVDWYPDPAWGFQIGRWSDNNEDFRIDATIDEVGVWKRALSTNEIADVMTNGL